MGLMAGKQGLVMGVANERSLAWGIARALHGQDARLAFTYQGDALGRRVRPLAESLDSDFVIEADVTSEESLDAVFDGLARRWGRLDRYGAGGFTAGINPRTRRPLNFALLFFATSHTLIEN